MEAKKSEVVKNWCKPKLIRDIQVFLGFANFYWRFIQGFNKIAAPLTSMLKISGSLNRPASSKNDSSRPISEKNNSNSEVDEFNSDGVEYAKKSGKSHGQNLAKSQKLSKSKGEKSKKLSKSRNLPNFNTTKAGPNFLTPNARESFNCLRLAFIEAPIFQHFDPQYYIRIETNALGNAIGGMLSQLASGIRPDEVVTKTDLSQ